MGRTRGAADINPDLVPGTTLGSLMPLIIPAPGKSRTFTHLHMQAQKLVHVNTKNFKKKVEEEIGD